MSAKVVILLVAALLGSSLAFVRWSKSSSHLVFRCLYIHVVMYFLIHLIYTGSCDDLHDLCDEGTPFCDHSTGKWECYHGEKYQCKRHERLPRKLSCKCNVYDGQWLCKKEYIGWINLTVYFLSPLSSYMYTCFKYVYIHMYTYYVRKWHIFSEWWTVHYGIIIYYIMSQWTVSTTHRIFWVTWFFSPSHATMDHLPAIYILIPHKPFTIEGTFPFNQVPFNQVKLEA